MKKIMICALVATTFAFANEAKPVNQCTYKQASTIKVAWKAYKTPLKVGVGGTFNKVTYHPKKRVGSSLSDILTGSTVEIDETSINSGNKGRDIKLVKFFFEKMKDDKIKGEIISVKADDKEPTHGLILTQITLNGISKKVPMKYSLKDGKLSAEGVIDIFDFSGSDALSSLNKACFEKHQGKTWNDITINFTADIDKECK